MTSPINHSAAARLQKQKSKGPNEKQLRRQIEAGRRNLAQQMDRLEAGQEKVLRIEAETKLAEQGLELDSSKIHELSRQMAKQASAEANERAQLEWEREEHKRRLQTIEIQKAQLEQRELDLAQKEALLVKQAEDQRWVKRVSDQYKYGTKPDVQMEKSAKSQDETAWDKYTKNVLL
jgi:hypothetical protein